MTKIQILSALKSDIQVYWCNSDFKVFEIDSTLYTEFKHSDNTAPLFDHEIWQCFTD